MYAGLIPECACTGGETADLEGDIVRDQKKRFEDLLNPVLLFTFEEIECGLRTQGKGSYLGRGRQGS